MKNNVDVLNGLEDKYEDIDGKYIYIKTISKYFWIEKSKFLSSGDMWHNTMLTTKELYWLRQNDTIKTYDDITYKFRWEEWKYNLLNEADILLPSDNPILHNDIKELFNSLCWWKKENIEYLHSCIYYKYLNINDFTIPAIIFHWTWWSGKWTLMSLLATIFWEGNVMKNLWQRELTGSFDTYKWQKIIVEFAEISSWNPYTDIKIINKLKNIIWSNVITVNEKGIQSYEISNIAWFFITSNSNTPLKLDSKEVWNRRFNVIKSKIKLKNWEAVNAIIKDKIIISNYLAWLELNYLDVKKYKQMPNLENKDKELLEDLSQDESNLFWEWLLSNFPKLKWQKLTIKEINWYIDKYCNENEILKSEIMKYFWKNSKYEKKKLRVWTKTPYGVIIE